MKNRFLVIFEIYTLIIIVLLASSVSTGKKETKIDNESINKNIDLIAKAKKEEEFIQNDIYTPIDYFNGFLTGYAANCPLCGGTLGCNGQNVLDGTIYYNDADYGEVRIVASSSNLKCGSIVQFNLDTVSNKPITAIVLDRGVTGTNLDLLVSATSDAYGIGRKYISYDVLRYGWSRSNS